MLNLLKKCALLLLIFSLPMQSLHALAMPLCNQGDQRAAAQQHPHGDVAAHDDDLQTPDINLACDGCDLCHTCSTPAIASVAIDLSLDTVETPTATPLSHILLIVPEQPQRPPLA